MLAGWGGLCSILFCSIQDISLNCYEWTVTCVRACMQACIGQKKSNRLHDMLVMLRQYATCVSPCLHSEGCGAEPCINAPRPPPTKPHASDYSCHLKCMTRDHCFLILSGLFRRLKRCPRAPLACLGDERVLARAFKISHPTCLMRCCLSAVRLAEPPLNPSPTFSVMFL